jgi:D-arabinose 1-dehydrogenase-like Zn-dependent alcohol dehydrogenase
MVMSCMECDLCNNGIEQHCSAGFCGTYGGKFPIGKGHDDCADGWTNGGYSTGVTVHQRFCFKVPLEMPLEIAGPLCCAGITLYAPLSRHVLGKQDLKVGIVGFGGLGMMGVKLAKSMGATVSIFSRSDSKKEEAEKMGADLVVYTDSEAMGKLGRTYDVIIDTVSQVHDIKSILSTLKPYVGTLVMIGGVPKPYEMSAFQLLAAGLRIEGSLIGGAALTQEMLDYCETHKCYPEIKVIHAKEAEAALRALDAGTGGAVRSVIDCSTIPEL